MSRTPVPFAPDTLESIRRAFRVASERRHDLVSLEHMLHALIEDPQAKDILTRCRVNLATLKTDLEEVLDRAFTPVPRRVGDPRADPVLRHHAPIWSAVAR